MIPIALIVLALAFAGAAPSGAQKPETPEKPPVGALPPHPLDAAFTGADSERAVMKALQDNELFRSAVAEALKAKKAQQAQFRKNKGFVGAKPEQAARVKFLEVLKNEPPGKE